MHFSAKHKENKTPKDPWLEMEIPAQSEKFQNASEFKLFIMRIFTNN